MDRFVLSTYILHQIFPFINNRSADDVTNQPIQVWFDDEGALTFSSLNSPISPKWGQPSFTIRPSLKKIQLAFAKSTSIKDEDRLLDALVISVFSEIRMKVDSMPLTKKQEARLIRSIEDERSDIDHLIHSLNTSCQGAVYQPKELH